MALPPYVHRLPEGTRLDVFVQPRSAKVGIAGVHGEALKLKVRAPAQDDKANRAVLELLARTLALPPRDLTLVSGRSSRHKRILVSDLDPAEVAARLAAVSPPG